MQGSNKLQLTPSVLPSLGADGPLLVIEPELLDDLMFPCLKSNEPRVDLAPRYPHEHSALNTVSSIY